MQGKIVNVGIDAVKEVLGLDESDEAWVVTNGFCFNDSASGLEIVAPRVYHVGIDHQLMNPANLLPDLYGRIPKAMGQGLASCAYGFLIGAFDSTKRRFSLLEATDYDGTDRLNTSAILVFSFCDRMVGAPGIKTADRKQINYLYYHESYDDAVYKTGGVQTFVLEVAGSPQLRTLVDQALKNRQKVLAHVNQSLEQFEANKDRVAQSIRKYLNSLMEIALPENWGFTVYSDSPDWTAWMMYELPPEGMKSFEGISQLARTGECYWHDQLGANKCKADVKALREVAFGGK